jgi:pyruvate dehydrogenase E1 component alpha subunit
MELSKEKLLSIYEKMLRIRTFEEKVGELFAKGKLAGFVHCYVGEEAVAVGVCENLNDNDYIASTHRGHGHLIAKGGITKYMMAELYGKATGYCKGKGGSMHIADASKGILGANGIVGAGFPIATGAGLSIKYRKTDQVSVCFFGDGASNRGAFHEALNLASIWDLPVVYVCENNQYGEFTSQKKHQKISNVADRAASYGMTGLIVDGNDVFGVYEAAATAIDKARKGGGPSLIECKTYRYRGHFEGDPQEYRSKEEVELWRKKDPILMLQKYLLDNNVCDSSKIKGLEEKITKEIEEAVEYAESSPDPEFKEALEDVYTDIVEEARL